jgi:predicted secreted protein
MKYGQNLRLFVFVDDSPAPYAVCASTSCTLHISATTEQSTTKDTEGNWEDYEVTGLSYDISADALVDVGTDTACQLNDFIEIMESSADYKSWSLATTEGTQNREIDDAICSGQASMASLQINAQNRQNANFSVSMSGYGAIVVNP